MYPDFQSPPVKVKLQIWDTAGEEKFKSVAPIYYKNTSAVALIYDITDPQSFSSLSQWHNEVESKYTNDNS